MLKFCLINFLLTRLFYVSIVTITFSYFIVGYDRSNELIDYDRVENRIERIILKFLKNFYTYDSIQFIHLAENGYTNDKNYAFFPLFPLMIKYFAGFLNFISGNYFTVKLTLYLISGFVISNILCFCNTMMIYRLTHFLTHSQVKSRIVSFLFLINPSTIIFISIYSENLFFSISLFLILMLLVNQQDSNLLSLFVYLILAMLSRSTAIFLSSYFIVPILVNVFVNGEKRYDSNSFFGNFIKFFKIFKRNIKYVGKFLLLLCHFFLCFLLMTKFKPIREICGTFHTNLKYNKNINDDYDNIIGEYSNLCYDSSLASNFYNYVQKKYWGVSLFSQYKWEYLDRIIIAIPMNVICILIVISIFKHFDFSLLFKMKLDKFLHADKAKNSSCNINNHLCENEHSHSNTTYNKSLVIYNSFLLASFINFLINFVIVVFIAFPHINNRVISTCPIFYLYAADEISKFALNKNFYLKGFLILTFFISYSILGCIFHPGSYVFT